MAEEKRTRDSKGRWLPGVSGFEGRRLVEFDLPLLTEMMTEEVEREIYAVAISRARAGDRHARAFLWAYRYGKPVETRRTMSDTDVQLTWGDDED